MNDPNWWQPAPAGSTCALHPAVAARATCPRCGNFACTDCTNNFQTNTCPQCRQRSQAAVAFPFTRQTWTIGALTEFTFQTFKRDWLMLSVSGLIFFAGAIGISMAGNVAQLALGALGPAGLVAGALFTMFLQIGVSGLFSMGMMRIALDAFEGRPVDLGRMFSVANRIGHYFGAAMLLFLVMVIPVVVVMVPLVMIGDFQEGQAPGGLEVGLMGVGTLVLIPWFFYVGLPYYLLPAEIAASERGPIEAIKHTFELAKGQRWRLFAITLIGGAAVMAGVMACCVGALPAFAFSQLLIGGVFLALSR